MKTTWVFTSLLILVAVGCSPKNRDSDGSAQATQVAHPSLIKGNEKSSRKLSEGPWLIEAEVIIEEEDRPLGSVLISSKDCSSSVRVYAGQIVGPASGPYPTTRRVKFPADRPECSVVLATFGEGDAVKLTESQTISAFHPREQNALHLKTASRVSASLIDVDLSEFPMTLSDPSLGVLGDRCLVTPHGPPPQRGWWPERIDETWSSRVRLRVYPSSCLLNITIDDVRREDGGSVLKMVWKLELNDELIAGNNRLTATRVQ